MKSSHPATLIAMLALSMLATPSSYAGEGVLLDARIHTMDGAKPVADALAWGLEGRIVAVGRRDEVLARAPGSPVHVAGELVKAGVGTLLFDLLTADEERRDSVDASLRFDIGLLTRRPAGATRWLQGEDWARSLSIGYFGASTGAAAALADAWFRRWL